MSQVIGLKFRPHGQVYFFLSGENEVAKGDKVIVETDQGQGCAEVVLLGDETNEGLVAATRSRDDFWGDAPNVTQSVEQDEQVATPNAVPIAVPITPPSVVQAVGNEVSKSGPQQPEGEARTTNAVTDAGKDSAPESTPEIAPVFAPGTESEPVPELADAQSTEAESVEAQPAESDKVASPAVDSEATPSAGAQAAPDAGAQADSDAGVGIAPDARDNETLEATSDTVDFQNRDLKAILRVAGPDDSEKIKENEVLASEAYQFCRQRVRERKLDMKLVDVEVFFDRSKIVFYFTAPTRIDFRELVKDLVKNYRTRIELRQIGVRHETQMIGAVGNCGMVCCCRRFLREFDPVTIKMAKEQNLFLNPTKISGICGRLLCCLGYEQPNYESFHRGCPKNGKKFYTNIGPVKVLRANLFRNTLSLLVDGHEERELSVDEWPSLEPRRPDEMSPEELKALQDQEQERRSRGRGKRSAPPRGRGGDRRGGSGDQAGGNRKQDTDDSRGNGGQDRKSEGRKSEGRKSEGRKPEGPKDDRGQDRRGRRGGPDRQADRSSERKGRGRRDREAPVAEHAPKAETRAKAETTPRVESAPVADTAQDVAQDIAPLGMVVDQPDPRGAGAPEAVTSESKAVVPAKTSASADDDGAIFLSKPAYEKVKPERAKSERVKSGEARDGRVQSGPPQGEAASASPARDDAEVRSGGREDSDRDPDGKGNRKSRSSRRRRKSGRKPKNGEQGAQQNGERSGQRDSSRSDSDKSDSGQRDSGRKKSGKDESGRSEPGPRDANKGPHKGADQGEAGDKPKPKRRRRRRPRGRGGKNKPEGES